MIYFLYVLIVSTKNENSHENFNEIATIKKIAARTPIIYRYTDCVTSFDSCNLYLILFIFLVLEVPHTKIHK